VISSSRLVERDHKLSLLLDVGAMLAREVELDALLEMLGHRIATALRAERATIYIVDAATGELRSRVADLPEMPEIRLPIGKGIAGYVADKGELVNVRDVAHDDRHFAGIDRATGYLTRNVLAAPITDKRKAIRGVVQVLNKKGGAFTAEDEAFLGTLASQVAQAFESTTLRPSPDAVRGVPLRGPFNHIVGASPAMRRVYEQILRASMTDATVLLRGETGVGKGLFARAIHVNSKRKDQPLAVLDCTTLPSALAESELFGHERGAFTGADRRVRGKVEQAEGGTLLLDEIGDLPMPAQSKLLRFLQERAFERVGGRETLVADVRILAATNHDLERAVKDGRFREDLYFRLNVIPVAVSPLRERPDDIPALVRHFAALQRRRSGQAAPDWTDDAIRLLARHRWPGNVRELANIVERLSILHAGKPIGAAEVAAVLPMGDGVSAPPLPDLVQAELTLSDTLDEHERLLIERALSAANGVVAEAARRLRTDRPNLYRRMKRLGIVAPAE